MISHDTRAPRASARLRAVLAQPGLVVMPGVYDVMSLRIVEKLGFPVALHGGYNCGATYAGLPDVGLVTMTESLAWARAMADAVDTPLIGDIDDGFGTLFNVRRTVHEVIHAGLAGILIEDQMPPRRSPSLGGNRIFPLEAAVQKLQVVSRVREKEDPDLVVIARTYASRLYGVDEAVARGKAYAEAGADIVWVDPGYSEETVDELRAIAERLGPFVHVVANMSETVGRPLLKNSELHAMGFKMVVYPVTAIMASLGAVWAVMSELKENDTTAGYVEHLMPLKKVAQLIGFDQVEEFEREVGGRF